MLIRHDDQSKTDERPTGIDYNAGARAYGRARTLPAPILDAWREAITALSLPSCHGVVVGPSATSTQARP